MLDLHSLATLPFVALFSLVMRVVGVLHQDVDEVVLLLAAVHRNLSLGHEIAQLLRLKPFNPIITLLEAIKCAMCVPCHIVLTLYCFRS